MHINFIAQPQQQLGTLLHSVLDGPDVPQSVVLVSAFASLQAVLRLKKRLHELHSAGAAVRLVVGVDMGGTSKEVLQELATWDIEVFVFKNKKGGVTFHPKLYLVEASQTAEIFLGSNNLTDGGLYGNYEGAVRVTYQLPDDTAEIVRAKVQLHKFLEPSLPIGRRLDATYLAQLLARKDIPDAAETRKRRKAARGEHEVGEAIVDVFGFEPTPGAPRLPIEVQQVVLAAVRHQLDELAQSKEAENKRRKADERRAKAQAAASGTVHVPVQTEVLHDPRAFVPLAQISPTEFYLELTATAESGPIPGEQRIPLEAINSAQDYWGWPDQYEESINPRKGENATGEKRVYLNWKPVWRVRDLSNAANDVTSPVRMYYYVNSSDFRFYSGVLARWAKAGDMVRITKHEGEPYVYECVLAVAGTAEHTAWKALCSAGSSHSQRVFTFA